MIDSVKIGGKTYPIMLRDDLYLKEDCQARILCRETRIELQEFLEPQFQRVCLIHEAIHGMLNMMGEHDKNCEETVERITAGIMMLIADNPKLFEID